MEWLKAAVDKAYQQWKDSWSGPSYIRDEYYKKYERLNELWEAYQESL